MPVKEESMVPARFTLPEKHANAVKALVDSREFTAEAEFYRTAVREYFEHHPNIPVPEKSAGEKVPA